MINRDESIPILFDSKHKCFACGGCLAICPKEAIIMNADDEGFHYPLIDESKCIRCYQCIRVCPASKCDDIHSSSYVE